MGRKGIQLVILNVQNTGSLGIITDVQPIQLPPNAWSGGQNVRTQDGSLEKFKGHQTYVTLTANFDGGGVSNTTDQAYWLLPIAEAAGYYWLIAGLEDVILYDQGAGTLAEITNAGADYNSTEALNWTGGIIGGVPVINNGVEDPQFLADITTPGKLADLTNWPASTTCKTMRVFKNYLVALNVTKTGTNYPTMVKWSDAASLGAVPGSWDETDATVDAGETVLAEKALDVSQGVLLDCLPLRDTNILYMDDSTWGMRYVGGSFVFQFYQIFKSQGILSRRCVQEFEGKHFVLGSGDVYVHDGNTSASVIDAKRRRALFNTLDPTNYEKCFVFANHPMNEMWVCFPDFSSTGLPNKAYVWNWRENTWGERDLPSTGHIERGVADINQTTDIWSTADGSWDDWTVAWGELNYNPQNASGVMACAGKLYKIDSSDTYDGTDVPVSIERTDLPIDGLDKVYHVQRMYPHMQGSGTVQIQVGTHFKVGSPVDWANPKTFTPGVDRKIDVRKTGSLAAVRVKSEDDLAWSISGYDLEYEVVGGR